MVLSPHHRCCDWLAIGSVVRYLVGVGSENYLVSISWEHWPSTRRLIRAQAFVESFAPDGTCHSLAGIPDRGYLRWVHNVFDVFMMRICPRIADSQRLLPLTIASVLLSIGGLCRVAINPSRFLIRPPLPKLNTSMSLWVRRRHVHCTAESAMPIADIAV